MKTNTRLANPSRLFLIGGLFAFLVLLGVLGLAVLRVQNLATLLPRPQAGGQACAPTEGSKNCCELIRQGKGYDQCKNFADRQWCSPQQCTGSRNTSLARCAIDRTTGEPSGPANCQCGAAWNAYCTGSGSSGGGTSGSSSCMTNCMTNVKPGNGTYCTAYCAGNNGSNGSNSDCVTTCVNSAAHKGNYSYCNSTCGTSSNGSCFDNCFKNIKPGNGSYCTNYCNGQGTNQSCFDSCFNSGAHKGNGTYCTTFCANNGSAGQLKRYEDSDLSFSFVSSSTRVANGYPSWDKLTNSSPYVLSGGSARQCNGLNNAGCYATLDLSSAGVNFDSIKIGAPTGSNRTSADVYVDGVKIGEDNTNAASYTTDFHNYLLWSSPSIACGQHTIKIVPNQRTGDGQKAFTLDFMDVHTCTSPTSLCTNDSSCPSGQVCQSGSCVAPAEASRCWGNTDGVGGKCYDCNGDHVINILDFSCFANRWQQNI